MIVGSRRRQFPVVRYIIHDLIHVNGVWRLAVSGDGSLHDRKVQSTT